MKKVAALNDISGFGKCSLSAAIPIISSLGVQACPLPTAVLSNQTCYESFYMCDLTEHMDGIINKWKELGFDFDGIYTGYIAGEKQAEKILEFVKDFKKEDTVFIADPVMGDEGEIYPNFTEELCRKIKLIAQKADIITPNITELGILSGKGADYVFKLKKDGSFLEKIHSLAKEVLQGNIKEVIVTGIIYDDGNGEMFCNAIVDKNGMSLVKSPVLKGSYSGTGDILASTICACAVRGIDVKKALRLASDFIYKAVEDTIKDGTDVHDGVNFEKFLYMLTEFGK